MRCRKEFCCNFLVSDFWGSGGAFWLRWNFDRMTFKDMVVFLKIGGHFLIRGNFSRSRFLGLRGIFYDRGITFFVNFVSFHDRRSFYWYFDRTFLWCRWDFFLDHYILFTQDQGDFWKITITPSLSAIKGTFYFSSKLIILPVRFSWLSIGPT